MNIRRLLIGIAVLVVVVAAGAVALRKPLFKEGLHWWLADLAVPFSALTVERLDHHALVLRDVSLGPSDVLSAGTVEVAYTLPGLLSGQIKAIHLEGLRITVDLARDPSLLASLTTLYQRTAARPVAGAGDAWVMIPRVSVSDARFLFTDVHASADIAFAANMEADAAGRLAANADVIAGRAATSATALESISGPVSVSVSSDANVQISSNLSIAAALPNLERLGPFAVQAQIEAAVDAGGQAIDISIGLNSPDAGVDLRASARLANLAGNPEATFDLFGSIDATGTAWNAVDGLAGGRGTVTAGFTGALALTPEMMTAPSPSAPTPQVRVTGQGRLAADALEVPGLGRAKTKQIAFDLIATEKSFNLEVLPNSTISAIAADSLKKDLSVFSAGLLDDEVSVELSRSVLSAALEAPVDGLMRWRGEIQPRIELRRRNGGSLTLQSNAAIEGLRFFEGLSAEGETDLSFEELSVVLPGLQAGGVRGNLAFGFDANRKTLDVRLLRTGALSFDALSAETVRIEAPVSVAVTAGTFKSERLTAPRPGFVASLTVQPDGPIRASVSAQGTEDRMVELRLSPVRLTGTAGEDGCSAGVVAIDEAEVTAAVEAVELQDTRVTLSHDCPGGGRSASASIGAARHLGDPPLLAPVSARAHLAGTEDGYAFDGAVSLIDGTELFVVAGGAATDGSSGEVSISRTAPLVFAAGRPVPGDFSPGLRTLKQVRGQLDGTARYRWSDGETSSEARLDLRDLSFNVGAVAVRDLDLDLVLEPAWPPVTPTDQALSIARLDVGAALEDAALENVTVGYALLPTVPTQLRVSGLDGGFLGGTFRLAPFTVNPAQPRTETVLHVDNLDMGALATLAGMETLNATGRLGGRIPLVLDDRKLVIRGGRLDAAGPGRLSFSSAKAAELLRGRGREVDLMLKALQDFRYESLGMDLDKTAGDDLSLKLSLLGNNPDVLEGQPFRINLNLQSQITPLLEALATLYRMSRETLERVWTTR